MTKTINCTNPSCETLISIPEGTQQVICPNCNTWHFTASFEAAAIPSNSLDNRAYDLPPTNDERGPIYVDDPLPEPFETPVGPAQNQPSSSTPVSKEQKTLGVLVSQTGERLLLKEGKNIIGRKNTDLIIDDRTVSRRHGVLEITPGNNGGWEYTIYDIGHLEGTASTNGIFISGRSLRLQDYERIPLGNGSSIRIGNVELTLRLDE